jgi:ATP-dependent RNA helicase DeaD
MKNFKETNLDENILKAISEMGFETPTSVQAKTIPHLLNSSVDLIATAQTGTGKTAAFGLPSIHLTDIKKQRYEHPNSLPNARTMYSDCKRYN